MAKSKKKTVTWWKTKVWKKAFSPFIRLRDALKTTGSPHTLLCVTCGKPYPAFGVGCAQAGHFLPGRSNTILFDEKQVNGQCYNCNVTLKGNWPKYLDVMESRHGFEEVRKMRTAAKVIRKFTIEELEGMFNHYTAEIKRLTDLPKTDILARKKVAIVPQERTEQ